MTTDQAKGKVQLQGFFARVFNYRTQAPLSPLLCPPFFFFSNLTDRPLIIVLILPSSPSVGLQPGAVAQAPQPNPECCKTKREQIQTRQIRNRIWLSVCLVGYTARGSMQYTFSTHRNGVYEDFTISRERTKLKYYLLNLGQPMQ